MRQYLLKGKKYLFLIGGILKTVQRPMQSSKSPRNSDIFERMQSEIYV